MKLFNKKSSSVVNRHAFNITLPDPSWQMTSENMMLFFFVLGRFFMHWIFSNIIAPNIETNRKPKNAKKHLLQTIVSNI